MMLKKFLFVSACCGLLAAPSVGAITQSPTYYEYKGFDFAGGDYSKSDGKTLTLPLNYRPTGWKVGSVYRAKEATAATMYFGTEADLEFAVSRGFIVDATDTATISESMVTCPVDAKYPYPVIRYEPYQYTIAFNANASPVSGSMAAQSGLSYTNTTTTLRSNAFTRTGYVFAGWTTAVSGSGTVFADQTTVGGEKFGVTKDGQTVTLYAKWSPQSYTIAYNEAGGTAGSSRPKSATYDAAFQVSAPTRTGYTFLGWTVSEYDANTAAWGTSSSSVASTLPSGGQITASGDIWLKNLTPTAGATVTLTARWSAKSYKVAYDEAGGTAGSSRPTAVAYDTAFQVSAPTRTGYTFLGWTVSEYDANTAAWGTTSSSVASPLPSGGQITASGDIWLKSLTPAASATVTLTARWSERGYKVAYDEAGGTAGSLRPTAAAYDTAFQVSAPTRTGYTFQGWTVSGHDAATARYGTTASSVASTLSSGGQITASGDIWLKNLTPAAGTTVTLTARWMVITCQVEFSAEGGRNGTASRGIDYGQTAAGFATIQPPEKANYTFQGYYTKTGGQGTRYFDADGRLLRTWDIAAETCTLYAHWTATSYIVTFNSNGGSGTVADQNVTYTETFALPLGSGLTPPSAGHLFGGWALSAHASGAAYSAGEKTSLSANSQYLSGGKLTFYAYWNATYIVRFDGNGSTTDDTMADQTISFDTPTALTPNAFARTGYTFAGWAQTNTPTLVSFTDGATVKGLATRAGDVVTLLAVWTPNTYYVAFDANGGEGTMPPLTNLYDRAFTLPANRFTHGNKFMVFSEWRDMATGQTYAEGDNKALNLTNAPFATVTLQAVWTNSLSALSQAMHCDNLNWQNDSLGGRTNPWLPHESGNGSGVGHGTDSCVWQKNGALAKQQFLWTKLEQTDRAGIKGRLSFWCKATNPGVTLMYGCSKNPRTVSNSISVPESDWLEVVVPISDTAAELYVSLLNATASGEGYCCIDGMTWTPDGENPTPGESDRVEAASLTWTANGLELSFTGDARFAYHLRATDSLSPTNWYDFGETNVGTDAAQAFVIPFDAAAPQRFFQIETIQKPTP